MQSHAAIVGAPFGSLPQSQPLRRSAKLCDELRSAGISLVVGCPRFSQQGQLSKLLKRGGFPIPNRGSFLGTLYPAHICRKRIFSNYPSSHSRSLDRASAGAKGSATVKRAARVAKRAAGDVQDAFGSATSEAMAGPRRTHFFSPHSSR